MPLGKPSYCFCCLLRFNLAVSKGSDQPKRNHTVLKQREAERTRGEEESTSEKETPPILSVYLHSYNHTCKQCVISQLWIWSGHHSQDGRKATAWPVVYSPPYDGENKHEKVLWLRDEARSSMTIQIPELLLKSGRSKTSQVLVWGWSHASCIQFWKISGLSPLPYFWLPTASANIN